MMEKLIAYFQSAHLYYAWALMGSWLVAYPIAWAMAKNGGSQRTILFHCRRAWAVALALHALFVTGLTVKWLLDYGYFPGFWGYFPWYLGMWMVDLYFIFAALSSLRRVESYSQS